MKVLAKEPKSFREGSLIDCFENNFLWLHFTPGSLENLRTKVLKFTKPKSEPTRFSAICNTYLSNTGCFLGGVMEVQGKAQCC
jgi:hypothetical protein